MKTIILISCVSRKGNSKAKAGELYKGPLFTNSLAYANKLNPDKIFILSALHHLLDLEKEIEPYDVTLSYIPVDKRAPGLKVLSKEETKLWGKKVLEQLAQVANLEEDKFIILADKSYIKPIEYGLNNIEEPMKGLKQGERVQFLINKIQSP